MGMTIDKCIEKLAHEKQCFIDELWGNDGELEAYDMAIDTMRKYQKIKEIMSELNGNFYGSYLKDRQALEKIYEVVDNGNNNQHN